MATAVAFVPNVFFSDAVGVSYGGGSLVILPELTQNWLNSFCHVLFCAI